MLRDYLKPPKPRCQGCGEGGQDYECVVCGLDHCHRCTVEDEENFCSEECKNED